VVRLDADTSPTVWLDPGGGVHHRVITGGPVRLGLRGLGGSPLSGDLVLTVSEPEPIREGPGPEVLLAPGDSRLFRFAVVEAGAVGVAVRSLSDEATCTLVSYLGEVMGEGVVQLHQLEPGEYLLAVRLPADAPPTTARPVVVGLERPGTGPPEHVIRQYLEEVLP
jgi:hypothetical protein